MTGEPDPIRRSFTSRIPPRSRAARYWSVTLTAVGLSVLLAWVLGDDSFERFFGRLSPPVVVVSVGLIGAISLRILAARRWLPSAELALGPLFRVALIGVALAIPAVVVDCWIPFPEDMNAPWPASLLFYPVMAYVAEIAFHVAPLALLLTALRWTLEPHPNNRSKAACAVVIVAAVEALFHTVDVLTGADQRLAVFVAPHLMIFGIGGLAILRRYGFLAMLSFRLGYYLVWHVVWGAVRLAVLF